MDSHKTTFGDTEVSNLQSGAAAILMPRKSRYADQAIDLSSRRSIEIQSGGSGTELVNPTDTHSIVAYFYHEGQFWRAIVPLDGVDQVFGQTFNFSKSKTRLGSNGREVLFDKRGIPKRSIPFLNHIQSRFTLRPDQPIELYPMGSDEFSVPVHRIHDIVYSFEAVGPVGITFNIRDGLMGNLISAHLFLSIREMVFERLVIENQYVSESPPLPLNDREKRELLIGSLLRSHRAGTTERYFLYRVCGTNNCTSNPFRVLDDIVSYRLPQRIGSILYRLPLNPRFYLWVRGMDSDPSFHKLVRSDFESYIADAETQQRKRDDVRRQTRIRRAVRKSDDTQL